MARSLREYGRGFWFKLFAIAVFDALALYSFLVLISTEGSNRLMMVLLVVGTVFINWVYLWPNTLALRWVTPGLIFMGIFVVIPIIYTVYVSLTNYQTGNVNSKAQTIEVFEGQVYVDPESAGELFDLPFKGRREIHGFRCGLIRRRNQRRFQSVEPGSTIGLDRHHGASQTRSECVRINFNLFALSDVDHIHGHDQWQAQFHDLGDQE